MFGYFVWLHEGWVGYRENSRHNLSIFIYEEQIKYFNLWGVHVDILSISVERVSHRDLQAGCLLGFGKL